MLDQENKLGKTSEILPPEIVLRGYCDLLRNQLKAINLSNIEVSDVVERRETRDWKDDLTLAVAGLTRDSIGLFVSSEDAVGRKGYNRWNIRTVLTLPANARGALLWGEMGGLYTDTYFVCEGGVVKPVIPTSPLPIDGLLQNYLHLVHTASFRQVIENSPISNLSANKHATRNVLRRYGIPVPRGLLLDPQQDVWKQLQEFLTSTKSRGYVIKPNAGSGGEHVQLFDTRDFEAIPRALAHAEFLMNQGAPVILEERKTPVVIDRLDERAQVKADHSIRSIILVGDLGRWSSVFVDHEIRYRPNDNKPVNVSKGAGVTAFAPGIHLDRLIQISEMVGKALFDYAQRQGITTPQLVGLDIIFSPVSNRLNSPFVIEFNTGSVGGLGTLCQLNECTIEAVRKVLLPSLTNFLVGNHRKREEESSLTRIPHTQRSHDLFIQAHQSAKTLE